MLKWKNRSIYDLSKEELQQALGEAVLLSLSKENSFYSDDMVRHFSYGIIIGTAVSLVGSYLLI